MMFHDTWYDVTMRGTMSGWYDVYCVVERCTKVHLDGLRVYTDCAYKCYEGGTMLQCPFSV